MLVELFTSEGCSSCPPADRLLERLDPQAIVLSEHVDYWNHQGWKDPFSASIFTQRQEAYGRRFGLDSVYTPEMVVDGETEFNGADGRRALAEISQADRRPKAQVRISGTGFSRAVGLPPDAGAGRIVVFVQESDQGRVFGAAMTGPARN